MRETRMHRDMRASGERGCDSGEETGLIEAQKFAEHLRN